MIPKHVIQEVKEKAVIEEVIGRYLSLKKTGPRYTACCPFHNEKSASFTVYPTQQSFKCFGCGESGDVFTFMMKYENKSYPEAVLQVASFYNILIDDAKGNVIDAEKCKPEIRYRNATAEEIDGEYYFETKEFSEQDIRYVIADKVWDYLIKTAQRLDKDVLKEFTAEEKTKSAIRRATEVFKNYHFHALTSYTIIKNRKATSILATPDFPIYMFDEEDWKKIYKPMEPEKSNRFIYYGARPKDFMHGLSIISKAYLELQKKAEEEEEEQESDKKKSKKRKEEKLKDVIFCSGGSDGLNIAMLNLFPVWMNSESSKLTTGAFKNLQIKAEKVYHLPDIDKTGLRHAHELAIEHLDIHTIYLPNALKKKWVARGYGKDARDYFKYWTAWDFFDLMKVAWPYRFWTIQNRFDKQDNYIGIGYNVHMKYLLNFLTRVGFYRFKSEGEKEGYIYIQIVNNVVKKIENKDIRDFVNKFLEDRKVDADLMNVFLTTSKLNESAISNLPYIDIDFSDYDKDNQWMFFQDSVLKISEKEIEELSTKDCDKFVWEDEIIKHEAEKLPDFFTITKDEEKGFDIQIHDKRCLVFRYLINASRMFWREELETRLEGIADEAERNRYCEQQGFTDLQSHLAHGRPKHTWGKYREDNKFEIAGELLTDEEKREQKLHLINKIFAIGYMLHRYKTMSETYCLWAMDAKIADMNESHGRSGKSVMLFIISQFMKTETIPGRNQKVVEDKHIFGNVTKHTDFIFVDDASPYLPFNFFFPYITGPMTCDPKNNKKYTLSFLESPKMGFASNHPPKSDGGPSVNARILYCMFSDYYHVNQYDNYRETRKVSDDFNKTLIQDFTEDEWNYAINFMAQCLRFYLSAKVKIDPPMDNVNKRNLKAEMGDAFQGWADVYFAIDPDKPDDHHFNKFIPREELSDDFRIKTKQQFTPQKFLKNIKAWCHFNGFEFNPKDVSNKDGRIVRKHKTKDKDGNEEDKSAEMFYIRATPRKKLGEDEDLPF